MEEYALADFVFLRTPAFPKEILDQIYSGQSKEQMNYTSLLKSIFDDHYIDTALHGSTSQEFYAEFRKWMTEQDSSKANSKMEETLVRYLVRMTTRCVPFGLFCGFSVVDVSDTTAIRLDDGSRNITHLRLDMDYLQDIVEKLKADEGVMNGVRYYPNTSLYRINDTIKYVEYTTDTRIRKYTYTAIGHEDYLELVLGAARRGCTIQDMILVLKEFDAEINDGEAREYIAQLLDSQILISELEPNVTGGDNLSRLIEILERVGGGGRYLDILRKASALIGNKSYSIEKGDMLKNLIESLIGPKDHWSILQCDLEMATTQHSLNRKTIHTISEQLQNLSIFAYGISRSSLTNFIERFKARYDAMEVPMVEALDSDIGIGYGNSETTTRNSLTKDMHFNLEDRTEPALLKLDALSELITEKYLQCIRNGEFKIVLSDPEIIMLKEKGLDRKLPDSFFIHGSLLARTEEDLDKGDFKFQLRNVSGPPSCLTIGRFCYTSNILTEKIRSFSALEETLNPDAIYAEIIHLTDSRVGNVTIRPHLRNYEIEYLGKSGLDNEHKIPITDIMVSIRNNTVKLRSKELNREILPRLTNAHVFTTSYLPIYKFLGEVQRSNGSDWLSWNWNHLKGQRFLPRVEYKNIVLMTAKWLIRKEDLRLIDENSIKAEITNIFKSTIGSNVLPRYVAYMEELDKEFIIDLDSHISLRFLIGELNKHGKVLLEEYLQDGKNCWIKNIHGSKYSNEIMIPVSKVAGSRKHGNLPVKDTVDIPRKFILGGEWVYFKLYTSITGGEKILGTPTHGLVKELVSSGDVVQWHFIRYEDPEYHIRMRFRTNNDGTAFLRIIEKAQAVYHSLLENRVIYKVQIDTYEREIERYGSHTMLESEEIFTIDSKACVAFINLAGNYEERDERWLWALKAIDMFLDAFRYSPEEKKQLMKKSEQHFTKMLKGTNLAFKLINSKYKSYGREITDLLSANYHLPATSEFLHYGINILQERQSALLHIAPALSDKVTRHREIVLNNLVNSYIHMFINRLFISDPNKSEFMLYTMLGRHYVANINRQSRLT